MPVKVRKGLLKRALTLFTEIHPPLLNPVMADGGQLIG